MNPFWNSPVSTWAHYLSLYPEALQVKNASSKQQNLPNLESFVYNELPLAIRARNPQHISKDDYMRLVEWKMERGQSRPVLLGYARQLADGDIRKASTFAFQNLGNPRDAMTALNILRGCGPATGSAVLAANNNTYPFMSDELLVAVFGDRKYTLKAYLDLFEAVSKKVTELSSNSFGNIAWTAREVERAVFAQAMLPNNLPPQPSSGRRGSIDASRPYLSGPTTPQGQQNNALPKPVPSVGGTAVPQNFGIAPAATAGQETPVKRGRGRPRKNKPETPVQVTTSPVVGEKRKRGRPRKNKEENTQPKEPPVSPAVPKRGRGRPRKNKLPENEETKPEVTGDGSTPVRRGRGRPRKVRVEELPEAQPLDGRSTKRQRTQLS